MVVFQDLPAQLLIYFIFFTERCNRICSKIFQILFLLRQNQQLSLQAAMLPAGYVLQLVLKLQQNSQDRL